MQNRQKIMNSLLWAARIIPIVCFLGMALFLLFQHYEITADELLQYTPRSYPLAALVILGLYIVKSLSVLFPLSALYICTGTIFPPAAALLINLAGLTLGLTTGYFTGKLAGSEYVEKLLTKQNKTGKLRQLQSNNEWFFTYLLRVIKILPSDLVSMFLGSAGIKFHKFLLGSLAGLGPTLAATTFMGASISNPGSPAFIISTVVTLLITAISLFAYILTECKHNKQDGISGKT